MSHVRPFQSHRLDGRLKEGSDQPGHQNLEALATKSPKNTGILAGIRGYLKQGVAMLPVEAEPLYPLLRFKTNLQPETWSSLEEYAGG